MALIDVVRWEEAEAGLLARRFPPSGEPALRCGSQLLVHQGQAAVFLRDGRAVETFGAGRHTLVSANVPLLQEALHTLTGGADLFRAEVVFVTLRPLPGFGVASPCPFPVKHPRRGWTQVQANGSCLVRVSDPALFVSTLVGGHDAYSMEMLARFLGGSVRQRMSDLLNAHSQSFHRPLVEELYAEATGAMRPGFEELRELCGGDFGRYGLDLVELAVDRPTVVVPRNVSLPNPLPGAAFLEAELRRAPVHRDCCSGCLARVAPAATFCMQCGKPAAECPRCRAAAPRLARFCPGCGYRLPEIA